MGKGLGNIMCKERPPLFKPVIYLEVQHVLLPVYTYRITWSRLIDIKSTFTVRNG